MKKSYIIALAVAGWLAGQSAWAQTVVVDFDNSGQEDAITTAGTRNFAFQQANWSGGEVQSVDAQFRATGAHAYAAGSNGRVEFEQPVQQLQFFFVAEGSNASAEFLDTAGRVLGSASSNAATSQGDTDNYVSFASDTEPVSAIRFRGGFIDNFAYTLAREASSFVASEVIEGGWFEPATSGQGMVIDYLPTSPPQLFVAWFTYDDPSASDGQAQIGSGDQRWLTAQGEIDGGIATLTVYSSAGGEFDNGVAPAPSEVGQLTLNFTNCRQATADYELFAVNATGQIELQPVDPTQSGCDSPPE